MKCEANGCAAALEPKNLAGSAMGGPSPWLVTDIPPGWCVRVVENTDIGSGRLVVMCPVHSAGVVRAQDARTRIEVLREVAIQLLNCDTLRDIGEYQRELEAEIGLTS